MFSKAIVTEGVLDSNDIDVIAREKREIIRGSGALEFHLASETINDVGGLEMLKEENVRQALVVDLLGQRISTGTNVQAQLVDCS